MEEKEELVQDIIDEMDSEPIQDKKPNNTEKPHGTGTAFLFTILLLAVICGLIYFLCLNKPNKNNNQNKENNINNPEPAKDTLEYDELVEKAIITDKLGSYTVYSLETYNGVEYSIVNTSSKEIIVKTNNIISNSKHKSDTAKTREYILISNDELKVYSISNDLISQLELNNEVYERLINEKIIEKLDIKNNNTFKYTGNDVSGEQTLIIFDNGCDYHDKKTGENYKGVSIIYVIDKTTNKVTRLNSDSVETNSDICPYEDENENVYDKLNSKALENYTISDKKIINKVTNDEYKIYMGFIDSTGEESDYLFVLELDNLRGIYNKKEGYIIEPNYTDISCVDHSDEAYTICEKSYTTLIDGSKLISLKNGNVIIDSDRINELSNGNFIAKKDDKDTVYTSEGQKLLEASYIGYSKNIGYITIEDSKYTIYNEKFEKISLPSITDEVRIATDNYNMWIPGDLLLNVDLKDNDYFEYNDDKYTGEKTVFIKVECNESDSIYLIEGNKLVKLNKTKIKEDSNTCI